jgi:hypothetical protein
MQATQNARFVGVFPIDPEFDRPAGAWLGRYLQQHLSRAGWATSDFDNWRDCGWVIRCVRKAADLEVCFAAGDQGWFLQVAPTRFGWMTRLRGEVSAAARECHALARAVDECLRATGLCSAVSWAWDGDPARVPATESPPPPS